MEKLYYLLILCTAIFLCGLVFGYALGAGFKPRRVESIPAPPLPKPTRLTVSDSVASVAVAPDPNETPVARADREREERIKEEEARRR